MALEDQEIIFKEKKKKKGNKKGKSTATKPIASTHFEKKPKATPKFKVLVFAQLQVCSTFY